MGWATFAAMVKLLRRPGDLALGQRPIPLDRRLVGQAHVVGRDEVDRVHRRKEHEQALAWLKGNAEHGDIHKNID